MINSFRSAIVFHLGSFSWVLQSGSVVLWVAIANQNEPGKATGLYLASQSGLARTALGCPRGRLVFGGFFGWQLCGGSETALLPEPGAEKPGLLPGVVGLVVAPPGCRVWGVPTQAAEPGLGPSKWRRRVPHRLFCAMLRAPRKCSGEFGSLSTGNCVGLWVANKSMSCTTSERGSFSLPHCFLCLSEDWFILSDTLY